MTDITDAMATIKKSHDQMLAEIERLNRKIGLLTSTSTSLKLTTIHEMLVEARGNQAEVMRLLGVSKGTVHKVVRKKTDHLVLIRNGEYRYYSGFGGE